MEREHKIDRNLVGIVIAYFLIYVVWGSTYFFIGVALKDFPPFLLGALRFTVAGMILLCICYIRGERVFKRSLVMRSAVSGIVLLFIDMAVVMLAQRYVTSSFVAIIASSTTLWILLLDVPMWKHNFCSFFRIAGGMIGFSGVVMLYLEQLNSDLLSFHSGSGFLLLIVGCISWALGTLYAKYHSSREEEVNAFAGSAWQMLFASAMFWICSAVNGDMTEVNLKEVSTAGWFSLAYLILFGSLLAYSAYVWLLKIRPALEVGTHAYVNPFIAVLLGMFLGNEHITLIQISGLLLILLGVMLVSRK
ncbi:EamA family transporter [Bacteroides sp.]|uniref:EamA family transporter n=1 Tax=Bacteroides sp. TaxID=29523 RepID=UPI002615E534|nr:EamA family transporter [Bacteroides sp.]MDD3037797.1 EamA family transporter [Bacteroides sp.]